MTKKRIALGTVTAVSVFAIPVAAVVSCGGKHKMGTTVLLMDKTTNLKTNSFTRAIMAGIKKADPSGFATNVQEDTTSSRVAKVKELMERGAKNFVLGGFAMEAEKVANAIGDKAPNLISVDRDQSKTTNKHVASVTARAQEGSFLAGYLIAKHMHAPEFKSKQAFEDGKLKLGYLGGYRITSVTDFMYGIINGVKFYESLKENKVAPADAIEIIGGNGHDKDYFAQVWNPADTKFQTVWNRLTKQKPDVVIGSPENAIKFNKSKKGNKLLWAGLDVDAVKQYPMAKDQILLSIRKDSGVGVSKIIEALRKHGNKMENLTKKERFFDDGIENGTINLTAGLIGKSSIDEIYKPSSKVWTNAINTKINNVVQQ